MDAHQRELAEWLAELRDKALTEFVQDMIPALKQNGYDIEDLVNAIANHAATREDWQQASNYMQQAQEEIKKAKTAVNKDDR